MRKKVQADTLASETLKPTPKTTIQKGDQYEEEVASYIRQIYSSNNRVTIHCKKKYPQRYPDHTHLEIDISIEEKVYDDRDSEYDKLTIIECKDHKSRISRGVIDHLVGRKRDLRANEAICFSTHGFQRGAIDLARVEGIKLVVLEKGDVTATWLNRKSRPMISSAHFGNILRRLGIPPHIHIKESPEVIYGDIDFLALLDRLHPIDGISSVPYLPSEDIEKKALSVLPENYMDRRIDTNLISSLIEQHGYRVIKDPTLNDSELLGTCHFQNKEVRVSPQENDGRLAFTLAHELGHILLHSDLFRDNQIHVVDDPQENHSISNANVFIQSQRLEVQANMFASFLLMPSDLMWYLWAAFKKEQRIGKPNLYLDSQQVNQDLFSAITRKANTVTTVSKEALKYRLKGLNILKEDPYFRLP